MGDLLCGLHSLKRKRNVAGAKQEERLPEALAAEGVE